MLGVPVSEIDGSWSEREEGSCVMVLSSIVEARDADDDGDDDVEGEAKSTK